MILIAESGSTKTNWCIIDQTRGGTTLFQTAGINPFYQEESAIVHTLKQEFKSPERNFRAIYFYGAGCANAEVTAIVRNALSVFFTTPHIEVSSDLMAAARSLCGQTKGIVCILGTGSNSCYYDGNTIVKNVSPLGFILGDEGSGAVIGRQLLSDVLKNQLPANITKAFFDKYLLTPAEILNHIYKQPFPNRFAAGFTRFIHEHIEEPALKKIVTEAFGDFFSRNVLQYKHTTTLPVHFTGSISWYFKPQLLEAAGKFQLHPGAITRDPMPGLIEYHKKK